MRGGWVIVGMLASACGRLGFDEHARTGDGGDADDAAAVCADAPSSYQFVVGASCYRAAGTDEWRNSELDCEEGPGTHLVVIDSLAELTALVPLVAEQRTWIGISDRVTEGTFVGVTGALPAVLPWEPGAPAANGPDCVAWDPVAGTVVDETCTLARRRICEWDGIDADPTAY